MRETGSSNKVGTIRAIGGFYFRGECQEEGMLWVEVDLSWCGKRERVWTDYMKKGEQTE